MLTFVASSLKILKCIEWLEVEVKDFIFKFQIRISLINVGKSIKIVEDNLFHWKFRYSEKVTQIWEYLPPWIKFMKKFIMLTTSSSRSLPRPHVLKRPQSANPSPSISLAFWHTIVDHTPAQSSSCFQKLQNCNPKILTLSRKQFPHVSKYHLAVHQ